MDINNPRVAEALVKMMDVRIAKALAAHRPRFFVVGRVASNSPLMVQQEGSDVPVPVQNPNNLTLAVGNTVAIIWPNCVDNANRFVIFKY